MITLRQLAFVGTLTAVLPTVSADALPLVNGGDGRMGEAAPPTLVQYYYRGYPNWYYGPKWGGYGSAYNDRYRYGGYSAPFYGYYGYGYYPRYPYRFYPYRTYRYRY